MVFLKHKFGDLKNHLDSFLGEGNTLKAVETDSSISKETKVHFVKAFGEKLAADGIIPRSLLSCLPATNPWSIDFPSWIGSFDESTGKKVMVIGAEPHIHYEYLQTVYHFNNTQPADSYLSSAHPIFNYLASITAARLKITEKEALYECYLTDLFPMSPLRGNGLAVGTAQSIQSAIGNDHNWLSIRSRYARKNLPFEIHAVKPEIIITQGVAVFTEVMSALEIKTGVEFKAVKPVSGKAQYIRKATYQGIPIISVPHIGSRRMRTFWKKNLDEIKNIFSRI